MGKRLSDTDIHVITLSHQTSNTGGDMEEALVTVIHVINVDHIKLTILEETWIHGSSNTVTYM